MPNPSPDAFLPLKPLVFQVLLALADRERHGWSLVREVQQRGGFERIMPGNFYRTLRGMLADGLLSGRDWADIDHLDYREWLSRHGAARETLDSALVRGMYDLTFAYEAGDRSRPRFAAGLGLQLAARMLFDSKGSIFWRMQASNSIMLRPNAPSPYMMMTSLFGLASLAAMA